MTTPPLSHPVAVSQIAAALYLARKAKAQRAVAEGKLRRDAATELLRPWLAIACLCGADLPELDDPIADLRVMQTFPGGHWQSRSEDEARAPARQWSATLAAARDNALDRDDTKTAAQLITLMTALDVTTPYHPRPFERKPA